jgi:hypothetical protein
MAGLVSDAIRELHLPLEKFLKNSNVRQTSVCRLNFDKLEFVGHQTAPLPKGRV